MKTRYLFLSLLLAVVSFGHAQQNYSMCATAFVDSLQRARHPELGSLEKLEGWLNKKVEEHDQAPSQKKSSAYTIPVIVHVIHNGTAVGTGINISDAQIQSQIDALNENFKKLSVDMDTLSQPPFDATNWASLAADCELTFCLAQADTDGNVMATPGIERIDRDSLHIKGPPYDPTFIEDSIKPFTIWDPNKYLNIWVLRFSDGILGYATYPSGSTLADITSAMGTSTNDGVVVHFKSFGTIGDLLPTTNLGRSAVHEVGHWLGLKHIWGDASCGDDYCGDTPVQQSLSGGCPTFPQVTCSNGSDGNMFVNFMDYTSDKCKYMFTIDQKARMQTALQNSPMRISVASQNNCAPVQVNEYDKEGIFDIYPNPSSGTIHISFQKGTNYSNLDVVNIIGEKISVIMDDKQPDHITCSIPPVSGVYFVRAVFDGGLFVKKVLIAR